MKDYLNIAMPSKPEIVKDEGRSGIYQISNLYPGYGHTLGNSLRRMLLSSIPGSAITMVNIKGVDHEFATIDGIKEDVLTIVVNLKNVEVSINTESVRETITITKKGKGKVTAKDFKLPAQVEIANPDLHICEITDDKTEFVLEAVIEKGIGYKSKEEVKHADTTGYPIVLDANYSPIKRVKYEIANMRVGDRTDFNKLTLSIETNGSINPLEALTDAINTMIIQFQAMLGVQIDSSDKFKDIVKKVDKDSRKVLVEDLEIYKSTKELLQKNEIKTIGDIEDKGKEEILTISGISNKTIGDIEAELVKYGVTFK